MPFQWLTFQIYMPSLVAFLQSLMTTSYDGIVCDNTGFAVPGITDSQVIQVNTYLSGLTESGEQAKIQAQTQATTISDLLINAQTFGQGLINQYAAQNIVAGITQAGQTLAVQSYLNLLADMLYTGSLYGAIQVIEQLIADTSSTKTSLSPFVTNTILYTYLNQIQTYLGVALTPNPGS
jgi:hypothetical protein